MEASVVCVFSLLHVFRTVILSYLGTNNLPVAPRAPLHHLLPQVTLEVLSSVRIHEASSETDHSMSKHPPQIFLLTYGGNLYVITCFILKLCLLWYTHTDTIHYL